MFFNLRKKSEVNGCKLLNAVVLLRQNESKFHGFVLLVVCLQEELNLLMSVSIKHLCKYSVLLTDYM